MINLLVGIFELLIGNTFAYTIFGSLGGYFLSMGAILTPAFGVSAAYAKHPAEFRNMMGLFNICWGAVFIVFLIVAIRSNVFMVLIFSAVSITCILSAIGDFQAADGHKEAKKNLDRVRNTAQCLLPVANYLNSGCRYLPLHQFFTELVSPVYDARILCRLEAQVLHWRVGAQ